MIIKSCNGNCLQGRRQCDCESSESKDVSIIIFGFIAAMFVFGLVFTYA